MSSIPVKIPALKPISGSAFPSFDKMKELFDALLPAGDSDARTYLLEAIRDILSKGVDFENRNKWLTRQQFGRRSETISDTQMLLFDALSLTQANESCSEPKPEPDAEKAALEAQDAFQSLVSELDARLAEAEEAEKIARKKERAERRNRLKDPNPDGEATGEMGIRLPELERIVHEPPAPCLCGKCNGTHKVIATEQSERIDYIPARFIIHVDTRNVYAPCPSEESSITRSETADKPIDKGLCGYSLLAQILEWRYLDHIPFHHISAMTGRLGYPIAKSTLGSWADSAAKLLEPLLGKSREFFLKYEHVGVDDTRMLTLDPKGGKPIKGRIWCYVGYDNIQPMALFYEYTPNWKGEHPREILGKRKGTVQADGYNGADPDYHPTLDFSMCGCNTHSRRKFVNAFRVGEIVTAKAVLLYKKRYAVEKLAKFENAGSDERLALRQKYSVPIMTALEQWMKVRQAATDRGPMEDRALTYLSNQWPKLIKYLSDGRIPIDNNEVERQIRPVARARRLHLFAGSEVGAKRMAMFYTFVGNCRLAGVTPYEWLMDVLQKLKNGWPTEGLEALLPQNWALARAQANSLPLKQAA